MRVGGSARASVFRKGFKEPWRRQVDPREATRPKGRVVANRKLAAARRFRKGPPFRANGDKWKAGLTARYVRRSPRSNASGPEPFGMFHASGAFGRRSPGGGGRASVRSFNTVLHRVSLMGGSRGKGKKLSRKR